MTIVQIFLLAFAVSIPAIALLVAGRHSIVAYRAAQRDRRGLALLALVSIMCLIAMVVIVGAVWFGYGVAYGRKTVWDDLKLVLYTGLPFYALSYGFWRLAGFLGRRVRTPAAASADSPPRRDDV